MKVLLIVPDGVGIRNYLYSNFIAELQQQGADVLLFHQVTDGVLSQIKQIQPNINVYIQLPFYKESPMVRLLRETLAFARVLRNVKILANPTIIDFWHKKPSDFANWALVRSAEILGYLLSHSYKLVLKTDELFYSNVRKSSVIPKLRAVISDVKPDYILSLHQRAPITAPIIEVAKELQIKTGTVIFSWDNVPKARLITRYDDYFVWSDLMKDELLQVYPEIEAQNVIVSGTPQFEFYLRDEFYLSKKDFFAKYNLDVNRSTICFSSNDASSPYEPNYLSDLCTAIARLPGNERPQIIFRRCPVDKSTRFDHVLSAYQHMLTIIDPQWEQSDERNSFSTIYPLYSDISLLVNTVKHCDVVINLGSTMAHDFAVLDKPCLYFNYDPVKNSKFKVSRIFGYQHFKSMKQLVAVELINSKDEIAAKVINAIKNPQNVAPDRKVWLRKIVRHPLTESGRVIADSVMKPQGLTVVDKISAGNSSYKSNSF